MRLFRNKYLALLSNVLKSNTEGRSNKKDLATKGEYLAVKFLKKKGYKILQRNYRRRIGEIDIICYDHGDIVFVEVKTRYTDNYGPPEFSVTKAKKRQVIKVASYYIAEKNITDVEVRFDVVSIFFPPNTKHPKITHFKSAFARNDALN